MSHAYDADTRVAPLGEGASVMMAANAALTGLAAAPDLPPSDRALDIVGGRSLPGISIRPSSTPRSPR